MKAQRMRMPNGQAPPPKFETTVAEKADSQQTIVAPVNLTVSSLPTEGYVRTDTILKVLPIGRSTWWAGVKSGRYPAPVKFSRRITAWKVCDIRALLESGML